MTPKVMHAVALFGGLGFAALEFLAERASSRRIAKGARVYDQGDPARELYVLVSGEVHEVSPAGRGSAEVCCMRNYPGDSFGLMSVVDFQPRAASALAVSEVEVFVLKAADLDALYRFDVKAYALLVLNLARELSRRLRVREAEFLRLLTSGE